MIGNLYRVTSKELEEILKDSSLLEDKVYSEESDSLNNLLDLDKSWEGIFFLLTGYGIAEIDEAKAPLSWSVFGEQIIDEEQDMGYGPANYIDSSQVNELNKALDKISTESLAKKYDAKKMMELGIYPEVWEEKESFDYLMDYFEQLKEFYKVAEKENNAVISFIN